MSSPRPSDRDTDGTTFAPYPIPLGSGVDLRTAPRSRTRAALARLENASFRDERMFGRRPGHVGYPVADRDVYQLHGAAQFGEDRWCYGHGFIRGNEHHPRPRRTQGVFVHGDETTVWTGDRLLGHPGAPPPARWLGESHYWNRDNTEEDPRRRGLPAFLPHARHTYLSGDAFAHYDAALGKKYRLLVTDDTAALHLTVVSRATGQVAVRREIAANAAPRPRAVYSAGRLVVIWVEDGNLFITSASEESPDRWSDPTDIGNCSGEFDVHYVDERRFVVAWRSGTEINATYYSGETSEPVPFGAATELPLDQDATGALAVAVAPNGDLGLLFTISGATRIMVMTAAGEATASAEFTGAAAVACALAPRWLHADREAGATFVGYADTDGEVVIASVIGQEGGAPLVSTTDARTVHGAGLASSGFRVGDETFAWLIAEPPGEGFQDTYHLVAGADLMRVVGSSARGAATPLGDGVNRSVHPDPLLGYGTEDPTTARWHLVLPHKGVSPQDDEHRRSALIDLDFLPPLRTARFGAATYIAGALVHQYDGRDLVEAGWTQYPEIQSATPDTGGSMDEAEYLYRLYACWRNAAGEVFRSPALTAGPYEVTSGNTELNLVFNAVPFTNRPADEVYFELYRNEGSANGTTFYLLDRIVGNTFSAATLSYVDQAADSTILDNEIDPHNPAVGQSTELEEMAPPGCEIVASHGDRLWFCGGEIPPGTLAHSKLREGVEGVGWSDLVGTVDVDVSGAETTSLTSMNGALVVFQRSRVLTLQGGGPDNLGNGGFPPAEVEAAADGAVVHEGTGVTDLGVVYWSRGGPRLFNTGLQVTHIGDRVEPLASGLTPVGCAVLPGRREVRWYTADGTALLWDFSPSDETGRWAVWTGLRATGVAMGPDFPVLSMDDGRVLFEDPDAEDDAGHHFALAWSTWDLLGDVAQGRKVVLRVGIVGRGFSPHTLRTWIYYDGSPGWAEHWRWPAGEDLDLRGYGDVDTAVEDLTSAAASPDGVYRMEKALRRNPCSTIRVEMDDGGSHRNTLEPHELVVEFGPLNGVARTAPRTYTHQIPA